MTNKGKNKSNNTNLKPTIQQRIVHMYTKFQDSGIIIPEKKGGIQKILRNTDLRNTELQNTELRNTK